LAGVDELHKEYVTFKGGTNKRMSAQVIIQYCASILKGHSHEEAFEIILSGPN
jgi:hypothetical protein